MNIGYQMWDSIWNAKIQSIVSDKIGSLKIKAKEDILLINRFFLRTFDQDKIKVKKQIKDNKWISLGQILYVHM